MARITKILLLSGVIGLVMPAFADEMETTFRIENMDCAMCPITVRKAIERVDGVIEATVDYDAGTATVRYDDARTNPEEIAQGPTDVGYPATPDPL